MVTWARGLMGPPEDLGIKNTEIQKSRNTGIQKQFVLLVEGGHRVVGVAAGDPPYRPGVYWLFD